MFAQSIRHTLRLSFFAIVAGLSALWFGVDDISATQQLYLSTNDSANGTNDLYLLRDIQRGVYSLAAPGSVSVTTVNVGQDNQGFIPSGFGLTTVRTTEAPLADNAHVVIGTTHGYVLTYDANLTRRVHIKDICGACGLPAQEVAVGQFGDLPVAVASGHPLEGIDGHPNGGVSIVTFNEKMEFVGNVINTAGNLDPSVVDNESVFLSDLDLSALDFGEMDPKHEGNELLIGVSDMQRFIKTNSFFGGFRKDPNATASNPLPPIATWDMNDGTLSNGIQGPWYTPNQTIAQMKLVNAASTIHDLIPPHNGPRQEIIMTGNTNDFAGPSRPEGPHQFGNMTHQYTPSPPSTAAYRIENGGDHEDVMLNRPMLSIMDGELYSGTTDNADYSGDEIVLAGIGQIRILNGAFTAVGHPEPSSDRGHIETGEHVFHVEVADVLNNDGVAEIILATSGEPYFDPDFVTTEPTGIPFDGGRLLIYEHLVEGDTTVGSSPFVHDPLGINGDPRGATIELDADTWITGLARLFATEAPEGLAGDFNEDGFVDAADYTTWQDQLGSDTPLPNDNGIGAPVGIDLYGLWKDKWGTSSSANGLGAAVPEPSTCLLIVLALLGLVKLRCTR